MKKIILETPRLILRPPKKNDLNDLVEGSNDLKSAKYVASIPHPYKKKDGEWWIKRCQSSWRKKKSRFLPFFIELKEEKKVIGAIDICSINNTDKKCTTSSWMNPKYRRKGYMTEAKIAINDFAFNKLKLRKMETEVFSANKASIAAQKTMGYNYEGTRSKSVKSIATGRYHDVVMFGLLKSDWLKIRPKLKKKLKTNI